MKISTMPDNQPDTFDQTVVYTIGHSNRPFATFIDILIENGVERVVDVRTVPKSRHNPHLIWTRYRVRWLHMGSPTYMLRASVVCGEHDRIQSIAAGATHRFGDTLITCNRPNSPIVLQR
jgi:hypothetical protein